MRHPKVKLDYPLYDFKGRLVIQTKSANVEPHVEDKGFRKLATEPLRRSQDDATKSPPVTGPIVGIQIAPPVELSRK